MNEQPARRWLAAGLSILILLGCGLGCVTPHTGKGVNAGGLAVDFRYAPVDWQTAIGLPDDWQKTLVGRDGRLLYDYNKATARFDLQIVPGVEGEARWTGQSLLDPRVPVVQTTRQAGAVEIREETFAVAPDDQATYGTALGAPPANRNDILLIHLKNPGNGPAQVTPAVTIKLGHLPAELSNAQITRLTLDPRTVLASSRPFAVVNPGTESLTLRFGPVALGAGRQTTLALAVARNQSGAAPMPVSLARPAWLRRQAEKFWRRAPLPYGHFEVPDAGLQGLLDSAVRNIYQAREIKQGQPAFQVGATCYRGLWVVDGSFIMEAIAFLDRTAEARGGIEYLLGHQRPDGGFLLMDMPNPRHWKETGIVLWAVTRHARLTGDRAWLEAQWPRLERGVAYIHQLRINASADPAAPCTGLTPPGLSDGGLMFGPEYTNTYWSLAGLRAATEAARWLGREDEARAWGAEYADFLATFRRAAARDLRHDGQGNAYLPIAMDAPGGAVAAAVPVAAKDTPPVAPERAVAQKGQWAFLQAVYPGQVLAPDDPLVRGNMAMLKACEAEGLVRDTGWVKDGVWTYFGSFYAHAWLWLGERRKAVETLYAFANHASPLLAWREEQMPRGEGDTLFGDMPHNWASAELIRLTRNLLALERGDELHLCEGLPREWARPGAVTRLHDIQTEFGPIDLEVKVAEDGRAATVRLAGHWRTPPRRIVLHAAGWAGGGEAVELPVGARVERTINLAQ